MTEIRKARYALTKILNSFNKRKERTERRSKSNMEFSAFQISNLARMQQKFVVMGK